MKPRAHFASYTPPGKDSARAKAQAVLFLVSARCIDDLTIEQLAHRYRLSTATAASLLGIEKRRRGNG